jgi:hypothetical protein
VRKGELQVVLKHCKARIGLEVSFLGMAGSYQPPRAQCHQAKAGNEWQRTQSRLTALSVSTGDWIKFPIKY